VIAELKKDGSVELQIKRKLPFPRELVFEAWLSKDHLLRWMGPTEDIKPGFIEVDPQKEGKYRFGFDEKGSPDERHYVHGEYLTIEHPEKLVFTWIWEPPLPEAGVVSIVTVEFFEIESGTEMILTHQKFMDEKSCEKHRAGWIGTLDKMENHLKNVGKYK